MRKPPGFTIIELMIVVVIIGVLAAVAIPMFTGQMKKAKATEPKLQLNQLAKSAKTYYQANARFPQGTAAVLPGPDGEACNGPNRKFAVSQDWDTDPIWLELGFNLVEPNLFSYHYTSTGLATAEILAVGDLDCDKTLMTFTLSLTATDGVPASVLAEPATAD